MTPILCSIQLSCAIRQHGDCLHRSQCAEKELTEEETLILSAKYQDVWKKAPSFYRSTSWEGQINLRRTSIMVQSWMLQQGVFHKWVPDAGLHVHRLLNAQCSSPSDCLTCTARALAVIYTRLRRASIWPRAFVRVQGWDEGSDMCAHRARE